MKKKRIFYPTKNKKNNKINLNLFKKLNNFTKFIKFKKFNKFKKYNKINFYLKKFKKKNVL